MRNAGKDRPHLHTTLGRADVVGLHAPLAGGAVDVAAALAGLALGLRRRRRGLLLASLHAIDVADEVTAGAVDAVAAPVALQMGPSMALCVVVHQACTILRRLRCQNSSVSAVKLPV